MTDNIQFPIFLLVGGYDVTMSTIHRPKNTSYIRIGVVNFLNASPLIEGLSVVDGIEIVPDVPSALLGCLERGEVDIALASSIDYQLSSVDLGILPVGVLSSDGPSRTVQLCSRLPFKEVTKVYCDTDSHTSIVLLQIILKNLYDIYPEIVPTNFREMDQCDETWPETILLIGDKVVNNRFELEYPNTLDLGAAWKEQTDLPFVFATWFGRTDMSNTQLIKASMLLKRLLKCNQQRIEQVVASSSVSRGWDPIEALRYVTENMNYEFTEAHLQSLELFYSLAASQGLLHDVRPIHLLKA